MKSSKKLVPNFKNNVKLEIIQFLPPKISNKIMKRVNSDFYKLNKICLFLLFSQEKTNLSIIIIKPSDILHFIQSLILINPYNLFSLTLNMANVEISRVNLEYIIKRVCKFNNILTLNLNFKKINLSNENIEVLRITLKNLPFLLNLSLILDENSFSVCCLLQLSETIGSIYTLNRLSLSDTCFLNTKEREKYFNNLSELINLKALKLKVLNGNNTVNILNTLTFMLQNTKNITELTICTGCISSDTPLNPFYNSLIGLKSLKELNLHSNVINSVPQDNFLCYLGKINSLEKLNVDFSHNKTLKEIGLSCLYESFDQLSKLTELTLNLTYVEIGKERSKILGKTLDSLRFLNKLELCLKSNDIGKKEIKKISSGLKQLTFLTSLSLDLSDNYICETCIEYLIENLSPLNQMFKLCLNLNYNKKESQLGQLLGNFLKHMNLNDLKLELASCNLGENGAIELFEGLSLCKGLISLFLDLKRNRIGNNGVERIMSKLNNMKALTILHLKLQNNELKDIVNSFYKRKDLCNLLSGPFVIELVDKLTIF